MSDAKGNAVHTAAAALMALVSSIVVGANTEVIQASVTECIAHLFQSRSWANRVKAVRMVKEDLDVVRCCINELFWAGLNDEFIVAYYKFSSAVLLAAGPAAPAVDDSPVVTIDGVTQSERQHIRDNLLIDYRKDLLYGDMTHSDIDDMVELEYMDVKEQHIDQMWLEYTGR